MSRPLRRRLIRKHDLESHIHVAAATGQPLRPGFMPPFIHQSTHAAISTNETSPQIQYTNPNHHQSETPSPAQPSQSPAQGTQASSQQLQPSPPTQVTRRADLVSQIQVAAATGQPLLTASMLPLINQPTHTAISMNETSPQIQYTNPNHHPSETPSPAPPSQPPAQGTQGPLQPLQPAPSTQVTERADRVSQM
ncbi:uncharacterized protein [Leptinotarsa decemlineata]|uniref:uncharacterized protein n=1 Tax=Leptinotarsa decemlineata TaxID=7539 RepID=UPI003D30CAA1